jgi:hypothetical protein
MYVLLGAAGANCELERVGKQPHAKLWHTSTHFLAMLAFSCGSLIYTSWPDQNRIAVAKQAVPWPG